MADLSGFDLSGRNALITGSTRGIGRALAAGLQAAGATVILNGRDSARLDAVSAEMGCPGYAFDVTDEESTRAAIDRIEQEVGPLDILINNAGFQHRQPLLEVPLERFEAVLKADLTSAFIVGRSVARHMLPRGRGKIINICSVQTDLARPSIAAYSAAKGGLRNLTRSMAAEWAASGLQINGVAPGYFDTELTKALVEDEAFSAWVTGRTPAARWGQLEDLIGPAVFFASDASNFVNGQVLFVDGGMTVVI